LQLEKTLSDLERSYRELGEATGAAETARTRLMTALESASDGFALFDSQDRLILFNPRYLTFWPGMSDMIRTGMQFNEIVRLAVDRKAVIDAYREPEEWVRRRLRQHADPQGPSVHALSDGRWLQVDEKRTSDGGIVGVYTDITDLKRRETLQRETELAAKSNLLQATLDNIFEGVAVYDRDLVLVAWNNEFVRLFALPPQVVRRGARFDAFAEHLSGLGRHGVRLCAKLEPGTRAPLRFETDWLGGRTLEAQRNPMPDDGFVLTFDDITQRRRIEAALEEAKATLERRVEERTAALTRVNEQLQTEIAERRDIEAALQIAKSEAEQANLGKTKFLAAASHDLLQPLNAARLFVSALSELDQVERNRALIDNIDDSLGAVEDLLGALLDISRLDAGAVSPEITDFEAGALLVPLTTEYTALATEAGLQFRSVPSSCVLRTDMRLLRRIVQNFLSNAIRYTPQGRILLGCRRTAGGLRIEVWDTGAGIPAEKLDEIFEEFRQLENASLRYDRGIGLGLAIVKRIATTLNLAFGVRSTVDRGSVFYVVVPL
jgi:signal transduction histidine kinase